MKTRKILILLLTLSAAAAAQFSTRESITSIYTLESERDLLMARPTELIDMPTAFMLEGGQLASNLRFYEEGGLMGRLSVGISSRAMFGVSFGAQRLIGADNVLWNEMPGVHLVVRVLKEDPNLPELVIGVDTQGHGKYWRLDDYRDPANPDSIPQVDKSRQLLDRYSYKARGFYVMASKGYESVRKVGLHAGVSISTERADSDTDPTLFLGMDLELTHDLCALFEYDFAINDDRIKTSNNGRGYLNIGLRWAFTPGMGIEFDVKNLFSDNKGLPGITRILKLTYHGTIFPEN